MNNVLKLKEWLNFRFENTFEDLKFLNFFSKKMETRIKQKLLFFVRKKKQEHMGTASNFDGETCRKIHTLPRQVRTLIMDANLTSAITGIMLVTVNCWRNNY